MIAACAQAPSASELRKPAEDESSSPEERVVTTDASAAGEEEVDEDEFPDTEETGGTDGTVRPSTPDARGPADAVPAQDAGPRDTGAARPSDSADAATDAGKGGDDPDLDAGPMSQPDSGAGGESDAGGSDEPSTQCGTAAYPTDDACSECICAACSAQIATCYASSDAAKNQQCVAVQECAQANQCASRQCYCGSSVTCLLPDGACMASIETAVGSNSPFDVQTASEDPEHPVGRANAIGLCALDNCLAECGLMPL